MLLIDIPDSIFPTDHAGNLLCPKCQKQVSQCDCPVIEQKKPKQPPIKPHIRLEKSGRKGKAVTVIENLPRIETYLKNLAKQLKGKTGSGGTFYFNEKGGVVEIQGDHQDTIRAMFLNQ